MNSVGTRLAMLVGVFVFLAGGVASATPMMAHFSGTATDFYEETYAYSDSLGNSTNFSDNFGTETYNVDWYVCVDVEFTGQVVTDNPWQYKEENFYVGTVLGIFAVQFSGPTDSAALKNTVSGSYAQDWQTLSYFETMSGFAQYEEYSQTKWTETLPSVVNEMTLDQSYAFQTSLYYSLEPAIWSLLNIANGIEVSSTTLLADGTGEDPVTGAAFTSSLYHHTSRTTLYDGEFVGWEQCDGNDDLVPEPATLALMGIGLTALVLRRRV